MNFADGVMVILFDLFAHVQEVGMHGICIYYFSTKFNDKSSNFIIFLSAHELYFAIYYCILINDLHEFLNMNSKEIKYFWNMTYYYYFNMRDF